MLISYPLHSNTLAAGLLLYLQIAVLLGINSAILRVLEFFGFPASLITIALVLLLWGALITLNMFFEYGLDIVEATAAGQQEPPRMDATLVHMWNWDRLRLWKQAVFVGLLFGSGLHLRDAGHPLLMLLLWTVLLLGTPASFILNALSGRLGTMLDIRNLWIVIAKSQWYYPLALAWFVPLLLFGSVAPQLSVLQQLAGLPLFLYCGFSCFHVLGLAVRNNHDGFVPKVDFTADRALAGAISNHLLDLNKALGDAYEELRAGRTQPALQMLERFLASTGWQHFDKAFELIAVWPFPQAGVHVAACYLPHITRRQRYMRALELLQWCLARQTGFAQIDVATLDTLATQAAAPTQYRAIVTVTENLLHAQAGLRLPKPLRQRCLALATLLRDEKRVQAFMANAE